MNPFAKILEWIREAVRRMLLKPNTVQEALRVDVAISSKMAEALSLWSRMYVNESEWLSDFVKSLNLPAAISGEIARMTTIEMTVNITGSKRADYLAAQMARFIPRLREHIEGGNALGGLVLKPYPMNGELRIDALRADQFYPISFDGTGRINAVVFTDTLKRGQYYYTRLELHQLAGEQYTIKNQAYQSDSVASLGRLVPLTAVPEWADMEEETPFENITRPLYGYYRYPMANNIDPNSPLGPSCYSRSTDLIRQADEIWSNLIWEFESGKRAIDVDEQAFKKVDGRLVIPDKRLYRTYQGVKDVGDGGLFSAWSPEFRQAAISAGLNEILKRIEFNSGLAYGTLSDPQSVDKTATEIISSKQRSHATVVDTQKELADALDDLLYAMDTWATIYKLAPKGKWEASYEFDDSIIIDKEREQSLLSQGVSMQAVSLVEWRMRTFSETEEQARKMLALVAAPEPMFPDEE